MKVVLKPEQIAYPNGLEITVEGLAEDTGSAQPSQLFLEVHERKLKAHAWTGMSEDPTVSLEINPLPPQPSYEQPQENPCHT